MSMSEEEKTEHFKEIAAIAKKHLDAALKLKDLPMSRIEEVFNAREKISEALLLSMRGPVDLFK